MTILDTTTTDFSDPGKRRAWVQHQLKVQGRSLASLARELGVVRHAPGHALAKPYPKMERAIAETLGIPVQVLFPECYFPDGKRSIRIGRGDRKSIAKAITNDTTASQGAMFILTMLIDRGMPYESPGAGQADTGHVRGGTARVYGLRP